MFTALFSFLGGSVFRMVWGELAAFITKQQDHSQEIDRMRLQGELDKAAHERNLAAISLQADLQVKVIETQGEQSVNLVQSEAWKDAVISVGKTIGIVWLDAWNGAIRPGVATWSIVMMTLSEFSIVVLSDGVSQICYAALGIYLADRTLGKRGKCCRHSNWLVDSAEGSRGYASAPTFAPREFPLSVMVLLIMRICVGLLFSTLLSQDNAPRSCFNGIYGLCIFLRFSS
jgi:hypothetical protein